VRVIHSILICCSDQTVPEPDEPILIATKHVLISETGY
jgi:hypothetical protein